MNTPAQPRERLYFADWLRIGAFALLVLYHVGMLYVPWDFHVKLPPAYPALEPLMRLTNPWRMSLLFVVSGLATGLMLGRAGLARQRCKRLLWPLLFGMAVVVPPQAWLQVREQFGYTGGYPDFLRLYFGAYGGFCDAKQCLVLPTWNHLWFLPYLWSYTMLLLSALRLLPQAWRRHAADALARLAGWRLLLLPLLLLGALRLLLFPHFGETHALLDDWAAHAAYGPMFAFGVLLARRRVLLASLQALRWPALTLGLAGWLVLALYPGTVPGWPSVPEAWRAPMRLAFAVVQWCGVVAAFGFARRHLDFDHRWRAPLTEAVYPLYLVHQTIIIAAAVALRPLALAAGMQAALIVALTFGGGFAAWRLARRSGWLRPWLGLAPARVSAPALRRTAPRGV
ncbi:MAG TPA: acyltransferase [Rubrivivax sp.]|nr:acyltransferase [Rubrivivax sp.]HPO18840.1 acyltransferase [Rubrivivax sp.]